MAGAAGAGCLIAFAGGIGSGKSTIAEAVSRRLTLPVHSIDDDKLFVGKTEPEFDRWVAEGVPFPDDFRREVYGRALGRLGELAEQHPVVIVEEAFHRAKLREPFFQSARALFGRVCVIEIVVEPDVSIAHLENRARTEASHIAGKAMYDSFAAVADPILDPDLVVENNRDLESAVERVCDFLTAERLA
jgi:dephospho-CoA kinase